MQVALKQAVVASEMTYEDIAAEINARKLVDGGVTYNILNNMANGRKKPDDAIFAAVRKVLKLPASWPDEGKLVSLSGFPLAPIKVIGSVAAGEGAYTVDWPEREIYVPQALANLGGLGWLVDGDSMMPDLQPGMVAIFKEHRSPRPGMTFLVESPEKALRVKTLEWRNNGWILVSTNPAYPSEPLGDYALLGYLIGWYRQVGKRETLDSDPDGLRLTTQ